MPDTGITVSNIAPSLMVARSPGGSQQWQYSQRMISQRGRYLPFILLIFLRGTTSSVEKSFR